MADPPKPPPVPPPRVSSPSMSGPAPAVSASGSVPAIAPSVPRVSSPSVSGPVAAAPTSNPNPGASNPGVSKPGVSNPAVPPPAGSKSGLSKPGVTTTSGPVQTNEDGLPKRFGKYTLLRKLATGGMAELFLAIQKSVAGFEKLIVIKRILPSMNHDKAFIEMLLHEARIAATLSHPNIVQIFDVGSGGGHVLHRDGARPRRGHPLHRSADEEEGRARVPARARARASSSACARASRTRTRNAISTAAQLNIVHRDISPQNVVVTFTRRRENRRLRNREERHRNRQNETKSGKLKGKVPYMSPEQARGEAIDCAQRHLRDGRHAVRAHDGQAPLQRRERVRDAQAHLRARISAAVAGAPRLSRGARAHRDAGAREEHERPLPERARDAAGPRGLRSRQAHRRFEHRAQRVHAGALRGQARNRRRKRCSKASSSRTSSISNSRSTRRSTCPRRS